MIRIQLALVREQDNSSQKIRFSSKNQIVSLKWKSITTHG